MVRNKVNPARKDLGNRSIRGPSGAPMQLLQEQEVTNPEGNQVRMTIA